MRFVHNAAIVAALGAASVSWSCNGRGLAASAPGGEAPQAAVLPSRDPSPPVAAVSPRTETPDVARTLSRAFAATAKAVRASVVRLDVRKQRPAIAQGRGYPWGGAPPFGNVPPPFLPFQFGGAPDSPGPATPLGGTGSGIIIDSAGNVVTNSHVVDGFSEIQVTLSDGRQIPARLIGKDSRTDVAVVRLEQVPKDFVAARLGDSNQNRCRRVGARHRQPPRSRADGRLAGHHGPCSSPRRDLNQVSVAVQQPRGEVDQVEQSSRFAIQVQRRKEANGNLLVAGSHVRSLAGTDQLDSCSAHPSRRVLGRKHVQEFGRRQELFARDANCSRTHVITSSTPSFCRRLTIRDGRSPRIF